MSVDIGLHIFILFTFLTIFFFAYVSKLEKQSVDDTTNNLINDQTVTFLNELNSWDIKLNTGIKWDNVDKLAINMQNQYHTSVPYIEDNNKNLLKNSIIIIIIIFILLVLTIIFIKYFTKYDLQLKNIIITNIIVFSITGIIEYITEINKHLDFCILYKEWLKNYIPPTGIKCENCNKIFVNEEYLNEHKNKC